MKAVTSMTGRRRDWALASVAHLGFGASVGALLPLLPGDGHAPLPALALPLAVHQVP